VAPVDPSALLAAYDQQLRDDAETANAVSVIQHGPLRLATFSGGRGFITYRDLGGASVTAIRGLVRDALAHYVADARISEVEWKTRAHDHAPGLHEALVENGFMPEEPESIMLGEAHTLAVEVPLPEHVTVRRVTDEADVRAMTAMTDEVFGDPVSHDNAGDLLRRLRTGDDAMELWVAEVKGRMIGAGRLEPVRGAEFAGIWGGATREEWRGRGIYRALTAARARSALRMGKTLIHSDSTEYSRPILERSGLVKVSTTTPYNWKRT
jgi:predicted GNAT family acetyltransferase